MSSKTNCPYFSANYDFAFVCYVGHIAVYPQPKRGMATACSPKHTALAGSALSFMFAMV
jgi:hypothetical protein